MSVKVCEGHEELGEQTLVLKNKTTGKVVYAGWVTYLSIDHKFGTAEIRLAKKYDQIQEKRRDRARRVRKEQAELEEKRRNPNYDSMTREELIEDHKRLNKKDQYTEAMLMGGRL